MQYQTTVRSPFRPALSARPKSQFLWLLACALFFSALAPPVPAAACAHPCSAVNLSITINGSDAFIVASGFQTILAPSNASCACGFQLVPSLTSLDPPKIFTTTGTPVPAFGDASTSNFTSNSTTCGSFNGAAPGNWSAASAKLSSAISTSDPIEIRFHGKLAAGATFASLKRDIMAASRPIGAGEADSEGRLSNASAAFPNTVSVAQKSATASETLFADIVAIHEDSPASVELTVQDAEEGLSAVWVGSVGNAVARVPVFAPETREPVTVSIVMRKPDSPSTAEILACNAQGGCRSTRTTLVTVHPGADQRSVQNMTLEPAMSHAIFQNGDNGIRMLSLALNDRRFSIRPLAGGQLLDADLSLAAIDGENQLVCTARGDTDSRGLLVLTDAR